MVFVVCVVMCVSYQYSATAGNIAKMPVALRNSTIFKMLHLEVDKSNAKVRSRSVNPQKSHRNFLITGSNSNFQHHIAPLYSAVLLMCI